MWRGFGERRNEVDIPRTIGNSSNTFRCEGETELLEIKWVGDVLIPQSFFGKV